MSLKRFFRRAQWDDERARELEAHLAIEVDDNLARGMTPEAARAAARRKLGSEARIREEIYDMNTVAIVETVRCDLRDAVRQLRRRPMITVLALLLLTIGVGASAAALSVAYGVLLRPLPFPDANRLAALWEDGRGRRGQVSYPDFEDIQRAALFDVAAVFGSGRVTIASGGSEAERAGIIQSGPDLLRLLGARPLLGRLLESSDEGSDVAVISHRLWQSTFSADPNIIGRPMVMSGTPVTIVGVTTRDLAFELPVATDSVGGGFTIKDVDVWAPFNGAPNVVPSRAISTFQALVKLKPGQTLANAQAALDVVAARLAREYPETNSNRGFRLTALHDRIVETKSPAVVLAFAGALLILVVACANLTSLFLGEVPERRRDFALREALGAARARLVRQLAIEGLLVSTAGGLAGAVIARALVESYKRAADLPRPEAISFDLPVMAAIASLAIAAGLVARLAPLGRLRPAHEDLRASVSAYAASAPRARRTLVVVQLALAVVLSAVAVLLGISLRQMVLVDPGFAPEHTMSARVSAYATSYPQKADVVRFAYDLLPRLAAIPGARAVAAGQTIPLGGASVGTAVAVEGRQESMAERLTAGWQTVTPGYFHALGMPILAGRDFEAADLTRQSHHTVINRTLARRLFGDADPIGRRLGFGAQDQTDWHDVIGVVGDVRQGTLGEVPGPRVYDLFGEHWGRSLYVIVRGSTEPHALAPAIRAAVRQAGPDVPIFEERSLADVVDGTMSARRLATGFSMAIAAVSVLLAAIGLYGLLASSVASRTRELGIRRALGSSTSAVVRLVCTEAAALAGIGVVAGGIVAFGIARVIQSQLFGVQATDPRIIGAVAVALAVIGGVASYLPARRAASVDPAVALRDE